ncbi:hypothetical protein HG536_0D01010 [Torulaspora globosa]|uniref:Uncharacterized protein n=1 Tax=Torulaspora globosa TaxID=48254 RepID=A0A7G3ZGE3_9SACH|nr:uncharacterized protein HG536_0D01010 [Torulaspora globosa]QLL32579.1 hypothetical protein HG536_0D01010 [Torulaspora globosa]
MKEPWRRLLWIEQDYPDNYTDPDFIRLINGLRYNGKRAKPSKDATSTKKVRRNLFNFYNKVLNTLFIYIVFTLLQENRINPIPLALGMTTVVLCLTNRTPDKRRALNIKASLVIIFAMLTLSPVLKSLSKTTASDSIWILAFWLTIAYLGSLSTASISPPLNVSTNLLLAIVTVLASRLKSTTHVFCFLLSCIEINIILPNLIKLSDKYVSVLSHICVYYFVKTWFGWLYILLLDCLALFYLFVIPQWFVYWQIHYRGYESSLSRVWEAQKPILD